MASSILLFIYLFTCYTAQYVELPQPRIKPVPLQVEVQSLNHWNAREVLLLFNQKFPERK